MEGNQSSPGQFKRVVGRVIDMTPGKIGWGHNVLWATEGHDIETVALVTTPAPQVGDTFIYYTDDAEVIEVKPRRNPKDLYEIRVRPAPNPRVQPAATEPAEQAGRGPLGCDELLASHPLPEKKP